MARIDQIREMLVESPDDTFLRYALAMELKSAEEHEPALKQFGELMKDEPPYVPAFFMSGQILAAIDRTEEAQAILTQGITFAQQQGELHAAGEMTEFLASLEG